MCLVSFGLGLGLGLELGSRLVQTDITLTHLITQFFEINLSLCSIKLNKSSKQDKDKYSSKETKVYEG